MLVPHGISAESRDVLREAAVDQRARRRSWGHVRRHKREAPRGSAVPKILDRWIVIQRHSKRERLPEQFMVLIRVANVGVVPGEMIILGGIGHLHKTAEVTSPGAGKKQGNVLRKLEIAVLRARLRRTGIRKRSVKYHRKRKHFQQAQRRVVILFVVRHLRLGRKYVSVQFEFSPERRQLRRRKVTSRARQPGLARIARHSLRLGFPYEE